MTIAVIQARFFAKKLATMLKMFNGNFILIVLNLSFLMFNFLRFNGLN